MIYVIKYSGYKNKELLNLIKIGFTDNWERRFLMYKSSCPLVEVLFKIPEGTREDEKRLHFKFQKYKYKDYGNEWFIENEEILNFFKDCKYEDDIKSLPSGIKSFHMYFIPKRLSKRTDILKVFERVLELEGKEITTENIKTMLPVVKRKSSTPELVFEDLRSSNYYPSLLKTEWEDFSKDLYPTNPEVVKFFSEYDKIPQLMDRLKYLVEFSDLNDESLVNIIVHNLVDSDRVKQYFVHIGPERIKSLGYNITKLNSELGILVFDRELLDKEIYMNFEEGKRYANKYVKSTLRDIYSKVGYSQTPKAVDLENWFELSTCKITIDGKRENGIELVKKK